MKTETNLALKTDIITDSGIKGNGKIALYKCSRIAIMWQSRVRFFSEKLNFDSAAERKRF